MKPVGIVGTSISLFLLLAIAAPAYGQGNSDHQDKRNKQENSDKQNNGKKHGRGKSEAKPQTQHGRQDQAEAAPSRPERPQRVSDQNQRRQDVRSQQREQPVVEVRQKQDRPGGWDKGKKTGWNGGSVPPGQQRRLSQDRQQQMIVLQQQRVVQYRQHLESERNSAAQYAAQMQQQNRLAEYRYQQQYLARMRQQQADLQRARNYNNDPYYSTAPTYRYTRDGNSYETNQYGANSLRQAVNNGYSQGFPLE